MTQRRCPRREVTACWPRRRHAASMSPSPPADSQRDARAQDDADFINECRRSRAADDARLIPDIIDISLRCQRDFRGAADVAMSSFSAPYYTCPASRMPLSRSRYYDADAQPLVQLNRVAQRDSIGFYAPAYCHDEMTLRCIFKIVTCARLTFFVSLPHREELFTPSISFAMPILILLVKKTDIYFYTMPAIGLMPILNSFSARPQR